MFQEDTQTAVWSALVSKRFMGRNDSSCRSWAGLRERKKKHQSITNIFGEQHHLSPQGHHTELFSVGGEDLECFEASVLITLQEVSEMRRGHLSPGHLACLRWPLNPGVLGIWSQRSRPLALLSDPLNVWRPLVKKWNSLPLRRVTSHPSHPAKVWEHTDLCDLY